MARCVAAAVLGDEKPQGGPSARFSSGFGAHSRAFGPGTKYYLCGRYTPHIALLYIISVIVFTVVYDN